MVKKTTPTDEKALVIINETTSLLDRAKEVIALDAVYVGERIQELRDKYKDFKINGIKDMAGYKAAKEAVKGMKSICKIVEDRRMDFTRPLLSVRDELKTYADSIKGELETIYTPIELQIKEVDDAIEAARIALFKSRSKELMENGYEIANGLYVCGVIQISAEQIPGMEEEDFASYIAQGKAEIQRRRAEAERKQQEEDRLKKEREEFEREKREWAEQKAREQAKLDEKANELKAQTNALETTYETVVKPDSPTPAEGQNPDGSPVLSHISATDTETQAVGAMIAFDQDLPPVIDPAKEHAVKTVPLEMQNTSEKIREHNLAFQQGFEAFRFLAIKFVSDDTKKLTRAILKEFLQEAKPCEYSVTEYAKKTGVTRQAVLQRIGRNKLPKNVSAKKIGKQYIITVQDTE